MHVPVVGSDSEAKFWLAPKLEMVRNYRRSSPHLREVEELIEAHRDETTIAWTGRLASR
jgi:hypothetical protein